MIGYRVKMLREEKKCQLVNSQQNLEWQNLI